MPIGKARVAREGRDATLVAWGTMAYKSLQAAEVLAAEGIDIEVVDLRSIVPWDREAVLTSVAKTGRAAVVYEAHRTAGFGAEVLSTIAEEAFQELDAPLVRLAGLDTPIVAAGGISTLDQAEGILQRGEADLVAAARQSLADPDWVRKMRLGRGEEVRRCLYTNYCEGLDQKHKQVTCQLWDRVELDEPGVAKSSDGRRRLVAPAWEPAQSSQSSES